MAHGAIIVIGTAATTDEHIDELLTAALAHVRRSRLEPGCISHGVHRDVEDPNRLVFVEHWADRAALDAHFAVPDSMQIVEAIGRVGTVPPTLDIYTVGDPGPSPIG